MNFADAFTHCLRRRRAGIDMNGDDSRRLTYPVIYLVRMLVFLILAGFCVLILNRQIATAFMANPGLNGLIVGVLCVRHPARAAPGDPAVSRGEMGQRPARATPTRGQAADSACAGGAASARQARRRARDDAAAHMSSTSIGARLDESRDTARYLTGLLIFLGLLGTFWGLIATVGSIGGVIKSMQTRRATPASCSTI